MKAHVNGRELYVEVSGAEADDIEINEIYYVDAVNETVPDDVVDEISDKYASEIYEEWYQNKVGQAEAYFEGER